MTTHHAGEQFGFLASDGQKVNAYRWLPASGIELTGVVHIAHGMGEHAARYDWTARQLCSKGYVVVANDHRGHGKTATQLGDFGEDGWNRMIEDLHEMIRSHTESYPGLPKILFGHSMGAMLSEQYVTKYGQSIDALILSGSPGFSPSLVVWASRLLSRFENWRLKPLQSSPLFRYLIFGSANRAFENGSDELTGYEWLSRDPSEVRQYVSDPECGFVPFPASLKDMFDGVKLTQDKSNIRKIPADLPVYLFSGSADPVHGEMANIDRLLLAWQDCGLKTTTRFYPGGRHEMLNETNKEEVMSHLLAWLHSL